MFLSALDAVSILNTDEEVDFLDLVHLYFPEGLVDHLCNEPSITITPLVGRGQVAVAAGASNDDFYEDNPFDEERESANLEEAYDKRRCISSSR